MVHPLDFDPEQYLQSCTPRTTLAGVAQPLAVQMVDTRGFSNNSNFSTGLHLTAIADYENELSRLQELYALCVDFEVKPFPRKLDSKCQAAGYEALNRIQNQMTALKALIQELKQSG